MTENVRNIEFTIRDIRLTEGSCIVSSEIKDGVAKLVFEVGEKTVTNLNEEVFVLVPASSLSLTDDFMCYEPYKRREKYFKKRLVEVIKVGVKDFYRPKFDPSFNENGMICYRPGSSPAVGKTFRWWEKTAKEFCPERKSRLGTESEYTAFLGVLLKKLVADGWKVNEAWDAVCNDARMLGHYWNSEGARRNDFEPTGSREVCGYFDLGNTYKILDRFWMVGGCYYKYGNSFIDFVWCSINYHKDDDYSVGWIVLEK